MFSSSFWGRGEEIKYTVLYFLFSIHRFSFPGVFLYFLCLCVALHVLNFLGVSLLHLLLCSCVFFKPSIVFEITHIDHIDQCSNILPLIILFLIGTQIISLSLLLSSLVIFLVVISNNIALNIHVHVPLHLKHECLQEIHPKWYC